MRARTSDAPATRNRDRAGEVAAEVADRLSDPDRVSELWDGPEPFDVIPGVGPIPVAPSYTLIEGIPGVAVLWGEMGRRDPQARQRAHAHLSAAADRTPATGPYGLGLFGGLAALGAAATITATAPGHYRRISATVDSYVVRQAGTLLRAEQARLEGGLPLGSWAAFDSIAGLAGVGRYLLGRCVAAGDDDAAVRDVVAAICRYLVQLTRPLTVHGTSLPGWYVLPDEDQNVSQQLSPGASTGLAHGIAGPLSLLATAWRAGITVPGHEEAVHLIAEWLQARLRRNRYGCYWPGNISPDEEITSLADTPPTHRIGSWCWGTPGIARALQLAGRALGRPEWERTAVDAQRALFDNPEHDRELPDAALCHGLGGLLVATDLIAQDSGDPELAARASRTAEAMLELFDPEARYGYRHVLAASQGTVVPDRPGFLNGAAGAALALWEYAEAGPADRREPGALSWTALLMLG
jgi:hypothetical protein